MSAVACTVVTSGSSASIKLYVLRQVVLPSPRHVVSDIIPFLFVPGSAVGYPVAGEAEAVAVFLDFFPILFELPSMDELCTAAKINVTQRYANENPIRERYINKSMLRD